MRNHYPLAVFFIAAFCTAQPLFASEPAIQCLSIERNAYGSASLANHCNIAVEAFGCVQGVDCRHGTWGMTNTWTIRAGNS